MSLWNSNANKNWTRIQEHFFFGAFHPTRDYSVEVGQLVLVVAGACVLPEVVSVMSTKIV